MARPLRLEHPGAVWHVTSRGNNREDIYRSEEDHLKFLSIFAEAVRRFSWIVHAYTLMTNHFHLVIETPEPTLSRGMKWMNGKYAQWFNRKYQRCGHLFQGRFKGFLVEKESYLLNLISYVALNPVRARMVERPEQYRWSSYRATAGLEAVPPWLTTEWALTPFGLDLITQQQGYREYVDGRAGIERSPLDDAIGQLFLGTEGWIEKMRVLVESKLRSKEHPAEQRLVGRPTVARIIQVVAEVFKGTEDGIRNRHGGDARKLVSWLGCYEGIERLCGIAAALGLRSTSQVSVMIEQCERKLGKDDDLLAKLDRCRELLRTGPDRVLTASQTATHSIPLGS
jgi:REP element-mobilizing transposase RayT